MDFTFCSLTYNQEKLIIQQLESIKYQIENFGSNVNCTYVLADDHSTDNTCEVVKKWIEINPNLFHEVKYAISEVNKGIVGNFKNALNNITTRHFKILAGDDMYYRNNVFEMCDTEMFTITPVLFMNSNYVLSEGNYQFFRHLLECGSGERVKKFLQQQYQYGGGLTAPGIFYDRDLSDDEHIKILEDYTWIEDAPTFNYFLGKETTTVGVSIKPYIVYRDDSGISNTNGGISRRALLDKNTLRKKVHRRKLDLPNIINPYSYLSYLQMKLATRKKKTKDIANRLAQFDSVLGFEKVEFQNYIEYILAAVETFWKENNS